MKIKMNAMHEISSRPFVFINAAMSADGKIATIARKQTRISGSIDFDRMDELRDEPDVLMVSLVYHQAETGSDTESNMTDGMETELS